MKAYKGFNKDMTCRGFQFEEGKEYEEKKAECCSSGFHACEYPLDVLNYYNPAKSVYHEVEVDGYIDKSEDDMKIAATKIKIGASINLAGLVKAAIEYTKARVDKTKESDEDCGASSATGYCGASSATGNRGASSATGDYGASSATGYCGASSATGNYGASSATGNYGASSATGYCGASSATGDYGASSATGNCGVSSATGYKCRAIAGHEDAVAVAWGYKGIAKGVLGAHIVLADWEGDENEYRNPDKWTLKGAKMKKIDGKTIKPDVWYTIKDGKVMEANMEEYDI